MVDRQLPPQPRLHWELGTQPIGGYWKIDGTFSVLFEDSGSIVPPFPVVPVALGVLGFPVLFSVPVDPRNKTQGVIDSY